MTRNENNPGRVSPSTIEQMTRARNAGLCAPHHNPLGAPPQDVRCGRATLDLMDFFGYIMGRERGNPGYFGTGQFEQSSRETNIPIDRMPT